MSKKFTMKPVAAALGTTFAVTLMASPIAGAAENPFAATEFDRGYMVAGEEGKCGEGKCGGEKADGEGKCGGEKADGEGKCGGEKADGEGKCGGEKSDAEGKCGEGKCGG